jgi:hypothetical protein
MKSKNALAYLTGALKTDEKRFKKIDYWEFIFVLVIRFRLNCFLVMVKAQMPH